MIKIAGAKIAGIGIAALDIINFTESYPEEDSEVRATSQSIARGGNVANTLVVLSQLGHHCLWGGCLADDTSSLVIKDDLQKYNIDIAGVSVINNSCTPTSYITLNKENGSRTIVHHRDLPEYSLADFQQHFSQEILFNLDWLHFEGRNVNEVQQMIHTTKNSVPHLKISVEIEKNRPNIETLFTKPDVLFFSKQYALNNNHSSAESLLRHIKKVYFTATKSPTLVCTWGDNGAYALQDSILLHSPAVNIDSVIDTVVDTIGAGDTFNAGFIHSLIQSDNIELALKQACTLAGKKCQQQGFDSLSL